MVKKIKLFLLNILYLVAILYCIGGFIIPFFGWKLWLLYIYTGIVSYIPFGFIEDSYKHQKEKFYNPIGRRGRLSFFLYSISLQCGIMLLEKMGEAAQEIANNFPYIALYLVILLFANILFLGWVNLCNYAKRFHDIGLNASLWVIFIFLFTISSNIIINFHAVAGLLLGIPELCVFLWLCLKKAQKNA